MDDFDVDYDEAVEATEKLLVTVRNDDRRICSCGHGMSRHKFHPYKNVNVCKPAAYECPCIYMRPVMEVPNTRYFMRKSFGSGTNHALVLGYTASKEALGTEFSSKVEWLIPRACEACQRLTEKYYPTRVTAEGRPILDSDKDTGITAFFCEECRDPRKHIDDVLASDSN